MGRASKLKAVPAPVLLRLDLGCGPHKREGFQGVDRFPFVGVDQVVDLTTTPWPWANESVEEAHCSHFIEHLTAVQRVAFVNELYRVLIPGGKCQLIAPHWNSQRAYGDPTHVWPPMSEFWFFYLDRNWRQLHAPHTDVQAWPEGFNCHFEATWGYSLRQDLHVRNDEHKQYAMTNFKEACQDIMAHLTKR